MTHGIVHRANNERGEPGCLPCPGPLRMLRSYTPSRAIRHLQHIEIPPNTPFSFWKQIGRATRGKGYVPGRQISEGCLIPAIGGGLCQLSNALYDVALQIEAQLLERHAHSRVVPGSTAEQGRDATVYWNYVDLRFQAPFPLLLHATMSHDTLHIQVFGQRPLKEKEEKKKRTLSLELRQSIDIANHSCQSCGRVSCFRHKVTLPSTPYNESEIVQTAYLLDERTPEFEEIGRAHV